MVDWGELTLFLYITARMSGFVLFNPVLGRRNIPGIFRGGLIRREHTEGGMGSFGIIIALNIFKDREAELLKGLIMISVNLFFFQIFEKAFAACVIKRIPSF